MAKLVGPLFSLEARNKLGDALVYFPWKGRNVARSWTIPSNPRDILQKIIRQKMALAGQVISVVSLPQTGLLSGSSLYQGIKDVTPATQIWNAYFVQSIMDYIKDDADFTGMSADLATVGATIHTAWVTVAADLGLASITGVAYATTVAPELQLFAAANAAYGLALCGDFLDMSTYPSNWAAADVSDFGSEFQTVA